ncbi:MAG TPA: L,D-transpeptidase family protein [Holophaga sp.]|nr:L,D-transpeptidase family protein [Holophaga sp.]
MQARSAFRIVTSLLLSVLPMAGADKDLMVVHRKDAQTWVLEWRGKTYRCAVGKNGVAVPGEKREGDGKSPCGTYVLRGLYYRPDKIDRQKLPAALKPVALTVEDGWCDEPGAPEYNKFVKLPFAPSHEELWRKNDDLYDLILPLGYNDDPVVPGKGSAIFMHVARPNYGGTAGCVVLAKQDLLEVLRTVEPGCRIRIEFD